MKKAYDHINIGGINAKEKEPWERLYSYYYAALCNYSNKIVSNPDSAEDIVQGVLIKLWDSKTLFADLSGLTSYLYKAVYTRSINFLKSNQKLLSVEGLKVETENTEEYYIALALEEEIITNFYKALEEMSPQQREVILLTLKGDKMEEISNKLGVSLNTIKTHKKRAFSFLRSRMGESFAIIQLLLLS